MIHFGSRLRVRERSSSPIPAPATPATAAAIRCQNIYIPLKKIGLPNGSPTSTSTSCQSRSDVWLHYQLVIKRNASTFRGTNAFYQILNFLRRSLSGEGYGVSHCEVQHCAHCTEGLRGNAHPPLIRGVRDACSAGDEEPAQVQEDVHG